VKVRRAVRQMALKIEIRDAQNDPNYRNELVEKGGMLQVPCLKIVGPGQETRWLYESSDIIDYLKGRFGV
jgi:glutathione S-transferase